MKIHELPLLTKKTARKRVGRGIAAGQGKTAGRGTKGQNSRTGGGVSVGFEGGQTKLSMRLPKARGFKSRNRVKFQLIQTSQLNSLGKASVDVETLKTVNLIKTTRQPVKLLFDAAVDKKVTLKIQAASQTAIAAVEKAGGKVDILAKPTSEKPAKSSAGQQTAKTIRRPAEATTK
ncbi:50S ribosomal protein L15 [Candidatus Saccharibacteria bacterium]|nr:50S ribosomal protein L15 [Candidatus Saccharibacteria bacterium]